MYRIPFGANALSFHLPGGVTAQTVHSAKYLSNNNFVFYRQIRQKLIARVPSYFWTSARQPPLDDPAAATQAALDAPLASPPLEQFAAPARPRIVCIAFTDAARICRDNLLVPAIVARLRASEVADDNHASLRRRFAAC